MLTCEGLSLERIDEIKFGPTPVQIYPDVSRSDSAFILAGPELFRFDLPSGNFRASQVVFEESGVEVVLLIFPTDTRIAKTEFYPAFSCGFRPNRYLARPRKYRCWRYEGPNFFRRCRRK